MRRLVSLLAVLAFLLVPAHLYRHGKPSYHPAFAETDRGIDPFVSTCRKTGRYPFATTNTNLIYGDGLVQLGQAAGCWTPQNEPAIAVDPNDPNHLIAGANDYRLCCDQVGKNDGTGWAYISRDGGLTWTDRLLPMLTRQTGGQRFLSHADSAGDPAVAITDSGVAIYANIAFERTGNHSAIVVSRSTDGGQHWHNPRIVAHANDPATFLDKEAVAAGPHHLVAVTWTRFDSGAGIFGDAIVYAALSHNDGRSFGRPFEIAPGFEVAQGTAPAFAPDGTLYVAYEAADYTLATDVTAYSVLKPGAHRFSVYEIAPVYDSCYPQNTDQRNTLSGENFRVNSFPSVSIDPSSGTAAVVWTDDQGGCDQKFSDSQLRVSYVHLSHHSTPVTVTNGADKTMAAAAYRNGVLTVGFYTLSFADFPGGVDYAYVSSRDGFVEHRVSDGSSDPFTEFKGSFIGDYSAAAEGSDGVVHFVWSDARGGDFNIFGASVTP